ncbi:metallothionein [Myxococcus sp. RHSTA-1-4]|uniref:metallothionein n=1 Tax=Myxococcus sp. RHSTA-1-4 TaxID=2874601 RepID=UPI001CC03485|nr:metallothionein [Myxococcus sp. RHSTA-1-4]MBZ4417015.1 metallothionein [Myxococcus sp. RHSTA-1-4]
MTRIATMVAAGLMAGGLLLAPGAAHACEAHARAAAESQKAEPEAADSKASQRGEVERPLDALDSLIAGKCQCGSKADCTCKKGSCDCAKCKKPKRQVMDALRGRPAELKLEEARYDASAGIFI